MGCVTVAQAPTAPTISGESITRQAGTTTCNLRWSQNIAGYVVITIDGAAYPSAYYQAGANTAQLNNISLTGSHTVCVTGATA